MPLTNPAGVVLRYNGVDFGASTKTQAVRVTPVPDASGRTTSYNEYEFTFSTVVAGGPTSAAALTVRRAVTKNGGVFVYTGRGLGDININTGIVRDVLWGPWVKNVQFFPLGDQNAFRVTWTLTVRIPDCAGARYKGPFELSYTVAHDIDRYGYTTKTAAGHLRLAMNYTGNANHLLNDAVDDYREALCPPLANGFRRTYGPWVVSEDRTRLDFEIKDEEMGSNIPPPGIVDVKASHEVGTQLPFVRWTGTISAEYELAKPTRPGVAVEHFYGVLVRDRIDNANALSRLNLVQNAGIAAVTPLSANVSEPEVYGKVAKVRISLGYTFTYSFRNRLSPLAIAGLWRPVPGSNWTRWSQSLKGTALHPRGNAKFVFKVNDEDAIDLCSGPSPVSGTVLDWGLNIAGGFALPTSPFTLGVIDDSFPVPRRNESWLHYEQAIHVDQDSGVAPVRTLPTAAEWRDRVGTPGNRSGLTDFTPGARRLNAGNLLSFAAAEIAAAASGSRAPSVTPIPRAIDFGQKAAERLAFMARVRPLVFAHLRGSAARWGYPVPCPSLASVNGLTPALACRLDREEGFRQVTAAIAASTPIYFASWNLRYALPDVLEGDIPVPPNPFYGT